MKPNVHIDGLEKRWFIEEKIFSLVNADTVTSQETFLKMEVWEAGNTHARKEKRPCFVNLPQFERRNSFPRFFSETLCQDRLNLSK